MAHNKSVLLVGNGGSLKDSNLGSKIDEFDKVIRINEGKTIGWENDAGTKFTVWATFNPEKKFHKYFFGYKSKGYTDEQIRVILNGVNEIWYVHPLQVVRYRYPQLNNYLKKGYNIKYGTLELVEYVKQITPHATTGFILINLLNLLYDKFYIVGFDFMGLHADSNIHHYFTDTPIDIKGGDKIHNLKVESDYVNKLEKERKVIYLKKDTTIEKSKMICDPDKYICK